MKTAVRLFEYTESISLKSFGFYVIQILVPTSPRSTNMTPIGTIKFQRTIGDGGGKIWYGMNFEVSTDNVEHLSKMTKVAKAIKNHPEYSYDSQPSQILNLIGAVEYRLFNHDFYPVKQNGFGLYDVLRGDDVMTRVAATSEAAAKQKAVKAGYGDYDVKFNSVIQF
jgi:hypothetical protein